MKGREEVLKEQAEVIPKKTNLFLKQILIQKQSNKYFGDMPIFSVFLTS